MLDAATGIHGHGHADPNASIDVVAGSFVVLGVDPARLVAGRAPDTQDPAVFPVSDGQRVSMDVWSGYETGAA
jgi:hypothetical protein